MEKTKLTHLSNIRIFRDLTPTELAMMDRQLTMSTCEAGRIFYMPEDSGEVLFLLKKGRVQLYRLAPNGKKLIMATLGAGAIFGEMSLVGQGMHNAFAEAVEECILCVMGREDVERMIREKPDIAFRFVEVLGSRVQDLEQRLEDIAFKSIPSRLSALLLDLAVEQGSHNIVVGFTHQDLSEMLGTYRETVTQTLNDFKGEGWIEIGRKQILLNNISQLQALMGE